MNSQSPSYNLNVPGNDTALTDSSIQREVRFAVVIYGGVSLTIYINGIVQEMLNMVRSTAHSPGDPMGEKLTQLQRVYRALANLVGEPANRKRASTMTPADKGARPGKAALIDLGDAGVSKQEIEARIKQLIDQGAEVHTRFIVDILSGTSAGGINAIYLAKALANNMSIDSLARMWITQADMKLLLNDKKVQPAGIRESPPPSLLNGRWMYLQLLTALNAMNETEDKAQIPLVQDLDLFCTTTDLRGLPVTIALTDENVMEQRYRNVYHFRRRMAMDVDDFVPEMDSFLAFAARCTSSFPFAFEPMELGDIPEIATSTQQFSKQYLGVKSVDEGQAAALFGNKVASLAGAGRFADICSIYERTDTATLGQFSRRPFGDGGYLDNKPFTYAIETIKRRHASLPVDRKLIYIEPGPEDLSSAETLPAKGQDSRPSAIENSLDALVVLPRYETIRQDIESVIQWNGNVARLHRVLRYINREIHKDIDNSTLNGSGAEPDALSNNSYFRLRLSGTTDQLGSRLAEAMKVESSSAVGEALRSIAGVWRNRVFGTDFDDGDTRERLKQFLELFDFDYVERTIRFLRSRLQRNLSGEEERIALFKLSGITSKFMALAEKQLVLDLGELNNGPDALESWKQYLAFITDPKFAAQRLQILKKKPEKLHAMCQVDDAGRDDRVEWLFDDEECIHILNAPMGSARKPFDPIPFVEIVRHIADIVISTYTNGSTQESGEQFSSASSANKAQLQMRLEELRELFGYAGPDTKQIFDRQDVEIYPIIFGTALGEFEPIEIFRISPEDTTPIAGTTPPGCKGSPPLRGASLEAFGAFLDQDWRMSDMLRGRLDGAERLITAVLPDSDPNTSIVRESLICHAQEAIATEWASFAKQLNLKPSEQKQEMINRLREFVDRNGPTPAWVNKNSLSDKSSSKEKK